MECSNVIQERITAAGNKRMEERSWKEGWMEASYEGGEDTEGAEAPYMDGYHVQQYFWSLHPAFWVIMMVIVVMKENFSYHRRYCHILRNFHIFEEDVEVKLQMWEVRVGYGQEYRF